MVDLASALVLGLVQGLSEFLPISSSGHLLIVHHLLPGTAVRTLAYDVWLHGGTLLALLVYFRADLARLTRAALVSPRSEDGRLAWQVAAATLPVIVAALLGADAIEANLRSLLVVAAMLAAGSCLLFLGERFGRQQRGIASLTWAQVLLLGVAQVLALAPGLSRSGVVIAVALLLGVRREAAARFAFLLAVPTLLGAVLFQWRDIFSPASDVGAASLAVGFVAAFVAGYIAVAGLLSWVRQRSLAPFAWYRLAIAAFAICIYWLA